jgi:hypothetical protein
MDEELKPSAEELAEAEALARELEEPSSAPQPADALEAAALLRASVESELSDQRLDAVRERVLERAAPRAKVSWLPWAAPAAALAAAAAALLVFLPTAAPESTALPAPGAGLLKAQAEVAQGESAALLRATMKRYRTEYMTALRQRYTGSP